MGNPEGKGAGRPTKLVPELVEAIENDFLPWCKENPLKRLVRVDGGTRSINVPKPPTKVLLCNWLGDRFKGHKIIKGYIGEDDMSEWLKHIGEKDAKGNETPRSKLAFRFSEAVARVRREYEVILAENGLTEQYNPRLAAFLLSADHGKRERTDLTSGDKPLPAPILGGLSRKKE